MHMTINITVLITQTGLAIAQKKQSMLLRPVRHGSDPTKRYPGIALKAYHFILARATERSQGVSFLIWPEHVLAQWRCVSEDLHTMMLVCLSVRLGYNVPCFHTHDRKVITANPLYIVQATRSVRRGGTLFSWVWGLL